MTVEAGATSFVPITGEGACGWKGRLVDDFGDASVCELAAEEQSRGDAIKPDATAKAKAKGRAEGAAKGKEWRRSTAAKDSRGRGR